MFLYLEAFHVTFDLPELNVQVANLLINQSNCAELFLNPSVDIDVMVQTNSDASTHIHRSAVVTTMSRSSHVGSTTFLEKKDKEYSLANCWGIWTKISFRRVTNSLCEEFKTFFEK